MPVSVPCASSSVVVVIIRVRCDVSIGTLPIVVCETGVGCVAGGVCIGILPIVVGETEVGCGVDGGVVVVVDVES